MTNLERRIQSYREEVLEAQEAHFRNQAEIVFSTAYFILSRPFLVNVTSRELLRHNLRYFLRQDYRYVEIPPTEFLSEEITRRLNFVDEHSLKVEAQRAIMTRYTAILLRNAFNLKETA